MKILAIRGKNLASLDKEFEINFSIHPLQSAGIFAITGQTGAGKSTILDALCLALFDNAPRLNRAESIKKEELERLDDKISPQDCRNILRRGASDGYAEVEFIALNSDKYRSRWMVRRANGKASGNLQPTYIKLDNLSTGEEEQGKKKELLLKITKIIGLTFEQFTRAVLLAQGDFANFLKAKQNEKAELLEKLTGTEIYSEISQSIYQKTGEAKNALELISQKIEEMNLLSDDEVQLLNQQKEDLNKELNPLKVVISAIENKQTWLKVNQQLQDELTITQNECASLQGKMEEATPRHKYLSLLDECQEIRDSYNSLIHRQKQQGVLNSNLQIKETKFKELSEKSKEVDEKLKVAKKIVKDTEQNYETIKDDIYKAQELDTKIKSEQGYRDQIDKEIRAFTKQNNDAEKNISLFKDAKSTLKQKEVTLLNWFTENHIYKELLPQITHIVATLKSSYSTNEQKQNAINSLESSNKILMTYIDQLQQQQEEEKRLNKLLPTEILTLRSRLLDGQPCPVCGSPNHPIHKSPEQEIRIGEEKLEAEKKKIQETILQIQEKIEKSQKSITEFEVHINNFEDQYQKSYYELAKLLQPVLNWQTKYQECTLEQELLKIDNQWKENNLELNKTIQELENCKIKIEAEQKSQKSIIDHLKEKEEQLKTWNQLLNKYTEERKLLLENKSVEEVEKHYSKIKKQNQEEYEKLIQSKEQTESDKASVQGAINQLKDDRKINDKQIVKLDKEVGEFINNKSSEISLNLLKDIISKTTGWVNQERIFLNSLKEQKLTVDATLQERKAKLAEHQKSKNKPLQEETMVILLKQLSEVKEKSDTIITNITEISLSLLNYEKSKEQIKSFQKEYDEKKELHEIWAKLNDLLGSANGYKFKTIAQGYTLDVLLEYANKHLKELTTRYKLEKIPNTLALQVIDNEMLGEVRTVHSLSGGESFLISLALALGLSSLSSNKMKIESLFIDEGFGALDMDTLSIAMDALERLQIQGRKIGVISHVEEMKERIITQIQVIKSNNGKSFIQVVG